MSRELRLRAERVLQYANLMRSGCHPSAYTVDEDAELLAIAALHVDESDKPRRAWEMTLKIGADSRDDLVALLESLLFDSLLFDSLKPGSNSSVTGGYSSGGYFTVVHDPDQTHDGYFEQIETIRSQSRKLPNQSVNQGEGNSDAVG